MRKSRKIKQLVAASAVTLSLFAATPNVASAGPIVCMASAGVAAAGWAGYAAYKLLTAPLTWWSTPTEVMAGGAVTIEFVSAACAAPTP